VTMTGPTPPVLASLAPARANELVGRFRDTSLLIIGDVMLDEFVVGRVNRISPEAPVPVVEFERQEYRIGGAGNVAHNAHALGARVELVGVIGRDTHGEHLLEELRLTGIGASGVVAHPARRTTRKTRIVTTRNQQVARIDYETDSDIDGDLGETLAERIAALARGCGAIVISDYLKGVITRAVMHAAVDAARAGGVPLLVDPKIPHVGLYRGATIVTPNHHEAETATHMRIRTADDARRAANAFRDLAGCERVLITRGEHGMYLLDGAEDGTLPAAAREVADVTGAGDTVIATLALAVAAGAATGEAAALANQAAGVVVGKFGAATVSREELLAAF
jgi:rfaE bifunctional protein kinase chain/domain